MKLLVADEATVTKLSDIGDYIEALEEMFRAQVKGGTIIPPRLVVTVPGQDAGFFSMPGYIQDSGALGAKLITSFPRNDGTQYPSHQGVILLFDPSHGELKALFEAATITALRTASCSGIATELLARRKIESLAVLGSGRQAQSHLDVMLKVRKVEKVRIWSRNPEHAAAFSSMAKLRHPGVSFEVASTPREAVEDAGVICTATGAREPVLKGSWIKDGAHVNCIGYAGPGAREIDTDLVRKSRLFTDRVESLLVEGGDFQAAKSEGSVDDSHVLGELGDLLLGTVEGRRSDDEVTLYRGLGIATEDLAVAEMLYRKALSGGSGTWVDLERPNDSE